MCLLSNAPPIQIKEDMKVVKIVRSAKPNLIDKIFRRIRYESEYREFKYIASKTYRKRNFLRKQKAAEALYGRLEPGLHTAYNDEGYHSYTSIEHYTGNGLFYVECTIPAGSWIIFGIDQDILSSAIRIDREIDRNQLKILCNVSD